MNRLAVFAGKIALALMKLRKGGSSLPGFVALKIAPSLLSALRMPKLVVAVTGTNGKTSSANLIAQIFRADGRTVAHNSKGANMMSGLATALIEKTSGLRVKADVAVLEIDEATVPLAFAQFQPHVMVINNFFRDQLERYGELETVISKVANSITSEQLLVGNGNDPLSTKVLLDHPANRRVFFGVDKTGQSLYSETQARESKWCPRCNEPLEYEFYHYSQIGVYHCPKCDFATPTLDYMATSVDLGNRTFTLAGDSYESGYDNLYFLFNIVGAIAVAREAGVAPQVIAKALTAFRIGDGRMESWRVRDAQTFLNLVKNPAGLNQTITHILAQCHETFSVFMALNNQAADSIDTSWIWDAAFESFDTDALDCFVCSGDRAYDLAVRLENAGIDPSKIVVKTDVAQALHYLRDETSGHPFMLTNYTPLQPVRRTLASFEENR